ncbi:MAG TPA: hypothetical protein GXZ79_01990 [Acholeplasma sp.]|nr:hypothetical protein [Acholeplasma sp.]
MKKILLPIGIVLTTVFLFILIGNNIKSSTLKVLTMNELHTYVYKDNQYISIPIYVNDKRIPLTNIDRVSRVGFESKDQSKKLEVNLQEIMFEHEERYLNETYYKFIYTFKMPLLNERFYIEDCYLSIRLENQKTYKYSIGSLYLNYTKSKNSDLFDWKSISGEKPKNSYESKIDKVLIQFNQMSFNIKRITIDGLNNLSYDIDEESNLLTIYTDYSFLINTYFPLMIDYEISGEDFTFVLDNYPFVIDYESLSENGLYINEYLFD